MVVEISPLKDIKKNNLIEKVTRVAEQCRKALSRQ